jgi:hypothetical protein
LGARIFVLAWPSIGVKVSHRKNDLPFRPLGRLAVALGASPWSWSGDVEAALARTFALSLGAGESDFLAYCFPVLRVDAGVFNWAHSPFLPEPPGWSLLVFSLTTQSLVHIRMRQFPQESRTNPQGKSLA